MQRSRRLRTPSPSSQQNRRYDNYLSKAYEAKGDHDAALKTLEGTVVKFPESSLWELLSKAYEAKGDYDAALKTLEGAVVKFPIESS